MVKQHGSVVNWLKS